jgi:hypothetical protein
MTEAGCTVAVAGLAPDCTRNWVVVIRISRWKVFARLFALFITTKTGFDRRFSQGEQFRERAGTPVALHALQNLVDNQPVLLDQTPALPAGVFLWMRFWR